MMKLQQRRLQHRLRPTQIATYCNQLQLPTTTQLLPQLLVPHKWISVTSPNVLELAAIPNYKYPSLSRTSPRRSCGAALLPIILRTSRRLGQGKAFAASKACQKGTFPTTYALHSRGDVPLPQGIRCSSAAVPSTAGNIDMEDKDDKPLVDRSPAKIWR